MMESGCSSRLNLMRMVVKMAAFPSIAVLLLCCSSVASTDSQCNLYVETNKDVTVPLGIPLQNIRQLVWKKAETIIFRRISDKLVVGDKEIVTSDGSLTLKKVSKDITATYTPEAYDTEGRAVKDMKSTKLCVIDPVPKPTLKIDCLKKQIKVTCIVTQTKGLNFAWVQNGKVLTGEKKQTLEVKEDKDLVTATFSCNVSNQVSTQASETKKQTCVKSGFSLPDKIFGISTWYFVGGGGGVVLLLIILVIICCIRMKKKKTMQVKDEEELRLGWTNHNQQHHHHQHSPAPNQPHHHHHHQQQPAGHTGPRQHRSKQPRSQQRPSRDPAHPNGQPQPSPRRAAQVPRPADTTDDEKPPPLPQPRKKAPKTARV